MPKVVITEKNIPIVLSIIDTWEGKLKWDLVCDQVCLVLGLKDGVKRQSLASYKEIQEAYTRRLVHLKVIGETKDTPLTQTENATVEYLRKQVATLKADVVRLEKKNEAYKQRFLLWQNNAYKHGVRMDSLDDALEMLEKPLSELKRSTGGS